MVSEQNMDRYWNQKAITVMADLIQIYEKVKLP